MKKIIFLVAIISNSCFPTYCMEIPYDRLESGIIQGNIDQVKQAIAAGIYPNAIAKLLNSAIGHAQISYSTKQPDASNRNAIIKILIESGISLNDRNVSSNLLEDLLLHDYPQKAIVDLLCTYPIKFKKNVNDWIIRHPRLKKELLEHQNFIEAEEDPTKEKLVQAIKNDQAIVVKALIKKGIRLKLKYLRKASKHKSHIVGKVLIEHLRLTQAIGTTGSLGPISKQGIIGVQGIPAEIVEQIARFIH